jgi:hypothetical protein
MIFGGLEFVVGAKLAGAKLLAAHGAHALAAKGGRWRSIRFRRRRVWPSTTASAPP